MSSSQTAPQKAHDRGQSLWLDNITRELLDDGTLARYIAELSVTGLTSNPSIFDAAIGNGNAYDESIRRKAKDGMFGEDLFIELALEDLRRAADLFMPIFDSTQQKDGWVSMEISPLLATDTQGSLAAAQHIHRKSARPNLFVKIPGTPESIPAIEEAIFAGIPVNVTLLFSCSQYMAAAEAYLRGIERRVQAGLNPQVASVASLFVSRWDVAVSGKVPRDLENTLGLAVCGQTLAAWHDLLKSARWQRLAAAGAVPQRLLWASTGTKDPTASDTLYVDALVAPDTINTLPEKTLLAFADHGAVDNVMAVDGSAAQRTLDRFKAEGIDLNALAKQLQLDGAQAFVKSWRQLLQRIADKGSALSDK
ncbi:MAG: transaldolase [Gammaproteobacteria bacterium]|nr:transaldolase [Gammaproteobacteria bacterium]